MRIPVLLSKNTSERSRRKVSGQALGGRAAHRAALAFRHAPTIADAVYAPGHRVFAPGDVRLDPPGDGCAQTLLAWPDMVAWRAAELEKPESQIPELEPDAEF
jgi:glutathione S-transferase